MPYLTSLNELSELFESIRQNNDKDKHTADVLLLTCIDFRFFDDISAVIKEKELCDNFDHLIVAGAELGPVVDFPPDPKLHWQQFFLEHLALSRDLHCIKKVLVLGHRDCGAYKKFKLLPENNVDLKLEESVHEVQSHRLRQLIERHQPGLAFEARLLDDLV